MKNNLKYILAVVAISLLTACNNSSVSDSKTEETEIIENRVYGILSDDYTLTDTVVLRGETMGKILNRHGISAADIYQLEQISKSVYPLTKIKLGNHYTTFTKTDSTATKLDYLVYECNNIDYVVFSFANDTLAVYTDSKPITTKRMVKSAVINTSMWGAIMGANLPYELAANIEDIYQWTVDFFAIKQGDAFTVIYEQKFVEDTISVGIGRVWGAEFKHGEQTYYAIPFVQDSVLQYWEADGGSLRKQMLKAPLKYTRVSSGFSYARLHPIYKVYRPHTGVDYAAPSGTPVHSVADGVVTFCGWSGGAGNYIKIKHPGGFETGYMHLRNFAKGIKLGAHVKQGQLIGNVGSTGASTGPHLDYRVWKGGKPINPLKIPQEPAVPIKDENKPAFETIKARIIAELEGKQHPDSIVTTLP
ncbi:MAG: peptidoglycan DD-metalloendopeptidase family protein [Bacteroidales bacterium]